MFLVNKLLVWKGSFKTFYSPSLAFSFFLGGGVGINPSLLTAVWGKFHQGVSERGFITRSHVWVMLSPLQGPYQPMIFPSLPPI